MQLLRKLAHGIFFKIVLGFVALVFIFTGISSSSLNFGAPWVAKIDGKKISLNSFNSELNKVRESILRRTNEKGAMQYLASPQFRSDVLSNMVNKVLLEKLSEDLEISANRDLILAQIAKNSAFKNKEGKFDYEIFKKFLAQSGIDENKYIADMQNQIAAAIAFQTFNSISPISFDYIKRLEEFSKEKRIASTLTLNISNVSDIKLPDEKTLQDFYQQHKTDYVKPEFRTISLITFNDKDFAKTLQVNDEEALKYYDSNKEQFQKAETRDFYHIIFDKEEDAKDFISKLKESNNDNIAQSFINLVKTSTNKSQKNIALNGISKKDLLPEVADTAFKLNSNEYNSQPLQSALGFHVFLTHKINASEAIAFDKVKDDIKKKIAEEGKEKLLSDKISQIDDTLLASNSISETAQKFAIKSTAKYTINKDGRNENGTISDEIAQLDDIVTTAFSLKNGETSKVLYSKQIAKYYAFKVDAIEESHQLEFNSIKQKVGNDWLIVEKGNKLQQLVRNIAAQLEKNPAEIEKIARSHKIKFDKAVEFSRFNNANQMMPDELSDKLFAVKIGGVVTTSAAENIKIALLKEIKHHTISDSEIQAIGGKYAEAFGQEITGQYNQFLLKKHPLEINDKLIKSQFEQEAAQ